MVALLTTLIVGGIAGAWAASAAASSFVSSEVGAKLSVSANGTQSIFIHGGSVRCSSVTTSYGLSEALESETLLVGVTYGGCQVFGLSATVSTALYELDANGEVNLLNEVTATTSGCTVTIPAMQKLKTVSYLNGSGNMSLTVAVTELKSSGAGPACAYAEESKGVYEGGLTVSLAGGATIKQAPAAPPALPVTGKGESLFGKVKEGVGKKIETFKFKANVEVTFEKAYIESLAGKEAFYIQERGLKDTCSKAKLIAGAECEIEVEFAPKGKEFYVAVLRYPYETVAAKAKYKKGAALLGEGV